MNNFPFRSYLTSNMNADDNLVQQLLSHCNNKQVAKGSFLLREGEQLPYSFFVESGLLRQYSVDAKGKEHILQFAPENWFMANRESEFLGQPSSYFIEAVEDSVVFVIEKELVQQLSRSNTGFVDFNTQLLHKHIASLQKRITQLQSASAKERYLDFIKVYPDILLRVPQTYVSSYLGITPESLSRIRKELASENQATS